MPDTQVTAKFEVTLEALRKAGACYEGYNRVVRSSQGQKFSEDDATRKSYIKFSHTGPIALLAILESNGLDDALWALRCVPGVNRDARLFAVWCARQVEHLWADQRSKDTLDVAERFANGEATEEERNAAWDAWAAADTAVYTAADTAAAVAIRVTLRGAAAAAADTAAAVAVAAAAAATAAAAAAAAAATRDVTRAAQKEMFIAMCEGRAPWQILE